MEEDAPPLTQQDGTSQVQYGSIFLFKEDIDEAEPFSIVPLHVFKDTDFPWASIKGLMSSQCRKEVWRFSNMDGKYRIFGKIEHGE